MSERVNVQVTKHRQTGHTQTDVVECKIGLSRRRILRRKDRREEEDDDDEREEDEDENGEEKVKSK